MASRFPGAPATLLHLPGEPVPLDSSPPDTVDSMDMTSDLRHRLVLGLSCQPESDDSSLESDLISTCIGALESVPFVSWSDLQSATAADPTSRALHDQILSGFPTDLRLLPSALRPYCRYSESLSVVDGVVMSGARVVIPPSLRLTILQGLHAAHQGVPAIKARAQDTVWWPNLSVDIAKI